ncbi:DUF1638 domain-containing protein [Limimaricola pyoseonensis]|uniref:DUF1638 domain-containing protein n=1 Tax=Limimaricola pyoseonensis TaxID=521013 RepID=A0A1G7AHT6_9RHOB|nr:DUF1638 domain-containing protein [Limimaricola pyoseonensis]SDE14027.1 Protein of unknown function [Limimaricola pyoseonensis]
MTDLPSDDQLTRSGLAPEGRGRVLLIACGALAREVLALIGRNGWDHLDLHCLPAILHNRPEKIAPAVEAAVQARGAGYDRVFVVYADCGTGGDLARTCERLGVGMVEGPHCYAFYEGVDAFAARGEVTSFYLTDFLVRQFDAFVWQPLGLDRHPDLRDMYFGNYETLVYQAQTDDEALTELARRHAERLGLEFERRATGYGELEGALARA